MHISRVVSGKTNPPRGSSSLNFRIKTKWVTETVRGHRTSGGPLEDTYRPYGGIDIPPVY